MLQADGSKCPCTASPTAIYVAAIMRDIASVIFLILVIIIVYLFKHLLIYIYQLTTVTLQISQIFLILQVPILLILPDALTENCMQHG